MTIHPNYYADHFRGQTVYRCCQCKYDSFSEYNARAHGLEHGPVMLHDRSEAPTRASYMANRLKGVTIVIGVITSESDWPTNSVFKARAEADRLVALGVKCRLACVDNGSKYSVLDLHKPLVDDFYSFSHNAGQSVARNKLIDYCMRIDAKYLHMVDGDIELIDYSTLTLAHQLHTMYSASEPVGCIGLYSRNCTSRLDNLSDVCLTELELYQLPGIAWTQYGMFNCAMFHDGIRFDEAPCFRGQGWGFEDDDLYCQMLDRGWASLNTKYYRYAHYSMNSSLRAMDPTLAAKVFDDRKSYVFEKWRSNPACSEHVHRMRNQSMPVIVPK